MSRRTLIVIVSLLLSLVMSPISAADDGSGMYTLHQRFGVNVATQFSGVPDYPGRLSDFAGADELGFGWYSDWSTRLDPERPNGIEYAQLLHTRRWPPDWNRLQAMVEANPGALWIIGNEPETRGQGQHTPAEYAVRYHGAYHFIKGVDPTAQVAIGGVVMPTPLRLRWLDLCMEYYRATYGETMPIDVWNIHVQILQEKRDGWGCGIPYGLDDVDQGRLYEIIDNCSVEIFEQLVLEFRAWLVEHGQGGKPLIISEYGVLMPSSYLRHGDDDVLAFMRGTFDFMLTARDKALGCAADGDLLVQRWMWFSLNFPSYDSTAGGFNGALYDWQRPDQLTVFGEAYRDYVSSVAFGSTYLPLFMDTFVDPAKPKEALGSQGRLKVRADAGGYGTTALLRFGLDGIPLGATVGRAVLELQTVARTNAQPLRLSLGPARCSWDEGLTYDAWLDCEAPRREALGVTLDGVGSRYALDVTDVVARWSSGALANEGFLLQADSAGNVTYDLSSAEWAEGPEPGPQLYVEYIHHR